MTRLLVTDSGDSAVCCHQCFLVSHQDLNPKMTEWCPPPAPLPARSTQPWALLAGKGRTAELGKGPAGRPEPS